MAAPSSTDARFLLPRSAGGHGGRHRYLLLPSAEEPSLAVDLDGERRMAAGAVLRWGGARRLPRATRLPIDGMPAFLEAMADAGIAQPSSWFLLLPRDSEHKRGVFFVRTDRGTVVVKFARTTSESARDKFAREERGLAVATAAGGTVARHAPTALGGFEVDGHVAAVHTAAPGWELGRLLHAPLPRVMKVRALERVAAWLVDVAIETARPATGDVPSVLAHGDLSDGNVLVGRSSLHVVDWELAERDGQPLWDLLFFATNALPLLDGVEGLDGHVEHLVRVFRGEHRTSPSLFGWVRAAAAASSLPASAVGRLATSCWDHHAVLRERLHGSDPWPVLARLADRWRTDPALGPGWSVWQKEDTR